MKPFLLLFVMIVLCSAVDIEERSEIEPRGKGLLIALITNLAIAISAKIGLYKIFLSVAILAASIKIFIVMAWILKIYKHIPDPYIHNKHTQYDTYGDSDNFDHYRPGSFDPYINKFDPHDKIKSGYETLDFIADFITKHHKGHFFYVVATKVVVLKIIYGGLLFAFICKGWKFIQWFIHYLKQKEHQHIYIDDHHYDYYDHHHDHYGSFDHKPYGYDNYGYASKKGVYDSDGSYSIKQH